MDVNFFYESGEIDEIGTGHKYRSIEIAKELTKRGHGVQFLGKNTDVLVIDHMDLQTDLIKKVRKQNTKVVLIDGHEDDVGHVDLSISAFKNSAAQYRGMDYVVFPCDSYSKWNKYNAGTTKKSVFVSMGGYDINNMAELVAAALNEMGMHAIVTKSINHNNLEDQFDNIDVFDGENYYDVMRECVMGITNGGLTMFQALFYGLPTIALPQYEHQKKNIDAVKHCCLSSKIDKDSIKENVSLIMSSEYMRSNISLLARYYVDGKGAKRVCALIEGVYNERSV